MQALGSAAQKSAVAPPQLRIRAQLTLTLITNIAQISATITDAWHIYKKFLSEAKALACSLMLSLSLGSLNVHMYIAKNLLLSASFCQLTLIENTAAVPVFDPVIAL